MSFGEFKFYDVKHHNTTVNDSKLLILSISQKAKIQYRFAFES